MESTSKEKRDDALEDVAHSQQTKPAAIVNKKSNALNEDVDGSGRDTKKKKKQSHPPEFKHRLFTYPSVAAARAAIKRSTEKNNNSKKRSRARSNDNDREPFSEDNASERPNSNNNNDNSNSSNNNNRALDDEQKNCSISSIIPESSSPVRMISRGSIAHIILCQLKGQVRTDDELNRLLEPESSPPPKPPVNNKDNSNNNDSNIQHQDDNLDEEEEDDDDNNESHAKGGDHFSSGDESMKLDENDNHREEQENDNHHSRPRKLVTIRDYVTSQMDPKTTSTSDLYKDQVRVFSGPYKGFIGKITPIGTPDWFMLSTSDGRMATIHADQMESWPFEEPAAAVKDVVHRRPKLAKDECEYFLEKLSSYIYQSDDKIEKEKVELDDLRQRIVKEKANAFNDENDGESLKTTTQDQLLDLLVAKEDKIAKMLAKHPTIKVAKQALDPMNKLKR